MEYIELEASISPLIVGREILIAELSLIGFESFKNIKEGVCAYIPKNSFNKHQLNDINILKNDDFNIDYTISTIKDQNWNEVWESNFEPIYVNNNCVIKAPFHKTETLEYTITINPQMSFGTGHHETTYLMVEKLLKMDLKEKNILDMGSGTGVLAILCSLKKANYIDAIDVDDWAYNNALENCKLNESNNISVYLGDANDIKNKYDLILANINRNVLIQDMDKYYKALNSNSKLLLSGFFDSDKNILVEKANSLGLKYISEKTRNNWMMLEFSK